MSVCDVCGHGMILHGCVNGVGYCSEGNGDWCDCTIQGKSYDEEIESLWDVNYVVKHSTFKGTHTVGDLVSIVVIVILWVESLEVVRLKIMQDEELCEII